MISMKREGDEEERMIQTKREMEMQRGTEGRSAHAECAVCVSATPCADAVLCAQPLSSAGVWTRLRADAALIDRIHKDTIRTRRAEHFFDEVSHFGLLSLSFCSPFTFQLFFLRSFLNALTSFSYWHLNQKVFCFDGNMLVDYT